MVIYLPLFSAFFVILLHKTVYSAFLQYSSHLTSENIYLQLITERFMYAVIYSLLGIVTFRIFLFKIFPEKRFTLKSPDKSILKMLLFSSISVLISVLFMLAFDFFFKSKRTDPGIEKHFDRNFFLVLFVTSSVIVTPILEEFFYRELLGKFLMERIGILTGLVFQGLFFALMHGYSTAPVIFTVGLACGIMFIKFGLRGSIFTHAVYNAIIVSSVFFNMKDGHSA